MKKFRNQLYALLLAAFVTFSGMGAAVQAGTPFFGGYPPEEETTEAVVGETTSFAEPETEVPTMPEPETEVPTQPEPEPETEMPAETKAQGGRSGFFSTTEGREEETTNFTEPVTEAPTMPEPETEAPAMPEPETEVPTQPEQEPETPAETKAQGGRSGFFSTTGQEPETEAPATPEPETEVPTMPEPETEAPVTEPEPETEVPTTPEPETEAPVTEPEPETEAPVEPVTGPEPGSPEAAAQAAFEELMNRLFVETASNNILDLHYLIRYPENYQITDVPVNFGDYSLEGQQEEFEISHQELAELQAIDRSALTPSQQKVYDIVLDYMIYTDALSPYLLYNELLSPATGIQTNVPILLAEYTFYSREDVDTYLELLTTLPDLYNQLIDMEKAKSEAGLFMSDTAVDDLVDSCSAFLQDQENHYLISTFDERVNALEGLTEEEKADYSARNREVFENYVAPAYQILIDGLTALKGTGVIEGGLANYPDGRAYYEALVAQTTGTEFTVDELTDLVNDYFYTDLTRLSFALIMHPEVSENFDSFSFTLTDPEEILLDLQEKVKADFPELPETSYVVKHVPEALQDVLSPAFYLTPCLDDYSVNSIYVNDGSLDGSSLYSTLAHEGYPGHLLQTVYELSHMEYPVLSAISTSGYKEGWASYVELQSYYWDDQPEEVLNIMSLNNSATLALYAMLDLGIHGQGWSREETGKILSDMLGIDDIETRDQVYNYVMESPTNYLWYYIGYLEFRMMREEAEEALGESFDAKAFHTFLLDMSNASFRVIRPCFDEWLAAQPRG